MYGGQWSRRSPAEPPTITETEVFGLVRALLLPGLHSETDSSLPGLVLMLEVIDGIIPCFFVNPAGFGRVLSLSITENISFD